MEVHAHTHTPRKKWTHYFWEFLMLFLAVIAGFYAENIREHKVEHRRGKEYLRSFLADLKTDTATYNWLVQEYDWKMRMLKDNHACFLLIRDHGEYNQCFSNILVSSIGFPDFISADRTLQQLKSSGALRLIAKQDADSITAYDAEIREFLQGERTGVQEAQSILRSVYADVLDYDVLYKSVLQPREMTFAPGSRLIRTSDQGKIDRMFIAITRYEQLVIGQYENFQHLNKRAISLINYFSTKYHFKN